MENKKKRSFFGKLHRVVAMVAVMSSSQLFADIPLYGPIYVDSTKGDDTWTGENADPVSGAMTGPVKSITAATNQLSVLRKTIYLRCGGQWWGQVKIPVAQQNVTIDRYGDCTGSNDPDIRAVMRGASGWTRQGATNIYTAQVTGPINYGVRSIWAQGQLLRPVTYPGAGFTNGYAVIGWITDGDNIIGINVGMPSRLPSSDVAGAGMTIRTTSYLEHVNIESIVYDDTPVIDSYPVTAMITLSANARFAGELKFGWGFYLDGKSWMPLTSGSWFYDKTGNSLSVWMPDGSTPAGKIIVANNDIPTINANGSTGLKLNNLSVSYGSVGISAIDASKLTVTNCKIQGAEMAAIDVSGSALTQTADGASISNNTISAVRRNGIVADRRMGLKVIGNKISSIGTGVYAVIPPNWIDTSYSEMPMFSAVRTYMGTDAVIQNNDIRDVGNIGIFAKRLAAQPVSAVGFVIRGNYVSQTCRMVDDCGAIYVSSEQADKQPLNAAIIYNFVDGTPEKGAPGSVYNGRPLSDPVYNAAIYLDDWANDAMVVNNTITASDYGVLIHNGFGNTLYGNNFWANRVNQVYQSEYGKGDAGDIRGNIFYANNFVQTGDKPVYEFSTLHASQMSYLKSFGSYNGNRYYLTAPGTFAKVNGTVSGTLGVSAWQTSDGVLGREVNSILIVQNANRPLLAGNSSFVSKQGDCTQFAAAPAGDTCQGYIYLENLNTVVWPITLSATSSKILIKSE